MTKILLKIGEYRKGDISEGANEINSFIDNRAINKNGILVIDRRRAYCGNRMDPVWSRRDYALSSPYTQQGILFRSFLPVMQALRQVIHK